MAATVLPGQVWRSTDRRQLRRVTVVKVYGSGGPGDMAEVVPVEGGRQTRVRIDAKGRLNRYELMEDRRG